MKSILLTTVSKHNKTRGVTKRRRRCFKYN